jgi:hypothetical protein
MKCADPTAIWSWKGYECCPRQNSRKSQCRLWRMKLYASPVWIYAQNCCNYQHHNCVRYSKAYIEYVNVYVTLCTFSIWIIWRRWMEIQFHRRLFWFQIWYSETSFFFWALVLIYFFKCLILKIQPFNQSMLFFLVIFFIWLLILLFYYFFFLRSFMKYFLKNIYHLTLNKDNKFNKLTQVILTFFKNIFFLILSYILF